MSSVKSQIMIVLVCIIYICLGPILEYDLESKTRNYEKIEAVDANWILYHGKNQRGIRGKSSILLVHWSCNNAL